MKIRSRPPIPQVQLNQLHEKRVEKDARHAWPTDIEAVARKYLFDFRTNVIDSRVVVIHPPSGHTYTFEINSAGVLAGLPVIGAPDAEMAYAQSRVTEASIAARDAWRASRNVP